VGVVAWIQWSVSEVHLFIAPILVGEGNVCFPSRFVIPLSFSTSVASASARCSFVSPWPGGLVGRTSPGQCLQLLRLRQIGRAVERLSQDWGLQPYQVSLAWLLSRPAVASAIVGAETEEEVRANATAADITMDQPSSTPCRHCQPARTTEPHSTPQDALEGAP
jgi:hypothetical protein